MIGIPFRLLRQHSEEGPVDTVLYLATRRSGEGGKALAAALRTMRQRQFDLMRALGKHRQGENEETTAALLTAQEAAIEAAQNVCRLSLTANYGAKRAEEAMDQLTDADLFEIVATIQTGEQPKDFFPSREPRPKASSTPSPDGSPSESSSSGDSPPASSSAER